MGTSVEAIDRLDPFGVIRLDVPLDKTVAGPRSLEARPLSPCPPPNRSDLSSVRRELCGPITRQHPRPNDAEIRAAMVAAGG